MWSCRPYTADPPIGDLLGYGERIGNPPLDGLVTDYVSVYAFGRTIGWIGHAIEQYRIDRLIRPRARYIGPPPSISSAAGGPQKTP